MYATCNSRTWFIKRVADIAAHSESVTRTLQESNSDFEDRLIKVQHSNEVHVNDLERYIKRNNVRIHGLTIHDEADCPTAVIHFLNSQLKMNNLTVADLEATHPLPSRAKKSEAQVASAALKSIPTVIVRFHNRNIRNEVIRNRKLLKGTRTSILEDLTSLNMQLLNCLKNDNKVSSAWSWNGKIFGLFKNGTKSAIKPFQTY